MATTGQATAQTAPFDDGAAIPQPETAEAVGLRNGSFVVAPIPFASPSLGSGLALGGAYFFKADEASGSSTIGFGAFGSDNESVGYALGWDVNFAGGKWTSSLLLADADLNFDLFTENRSVAVSQTLLGYSLELARAVSDSVEVGLGLSYGESTLSPRGEARLPEEFQRDVLIDLGRLTFRAEQDLRDDEFYPESGTLLSGTLTYGVTLDGSSRSYAKAVLAASQYWSVGPEAVLAARGTACATSEDAPFFDACALGAVDAFRGFSATQFIDTSLLSAQLEYRRRLTKRIGYVAFAGVGTIGGDFGEAVENDLKAAGGIGARIRLSQDFPIDYAIDLSFNDDRERILYISVGQRF